MGKEDSSDFRSIDPSKDRDSGGVVTGGGRREVPGGRVRSRSARCRGLRDDLRRVEEGVGVGRWGGVPMIVGSRVRVASM